MKLETVYCIYCQRHFAGSYSEEVARLHLETIHGKKGFVSDDDRFGNIRRKSIKVNTQNLLGYVTLVDLIDFNGIIEVANVPPCKTK